MASLTQVPGAQAQGRRRMALYNWTLSPHLEGAAQLCSRVAPAAVVAARPQRAVQHGLRDAVHTAQPKEVAEARVLRGQERETDCVYFGERISVCVCVCRCVCKLRRLGRASLWAVER